MILWRHPSIDNMTFSSLGADNLTFTNLTVPPSKVTWNSKKKLDNRVARWRFPVSTQRGEQPLASAEASSSDHLFQELKPGCPKKVIWKSNSDTKIEPHVLLSGEYINNEHSIPTDRFCFHTQLIFSGESMAPTVRNNSAEFEVLKQGFVPSNFASL